MKKRSSPEEPVARPVDVERVKLDALLPDPANANKGTERGAFMLEESLRECGAGRSLLADRNGILLGGNKTCEQAASLGIEDVIVVHTRGQELVVVQRDDLDLTEDEGGRARKLALYDNRAGEFLDWDYGQLAEHVAEGLDLAAMWFPDELQREAAAVEVFIPELDPEAPPAPAAPDAPAEPPPAEAPSLRVEGEPRGTRRGGRPPEGSLAAEPSAIRFDLQADGEQVWVKQGEQPAIAGIADVGCSIEMETRGGTRVIVTLSANGEAHLYVGRGAQDRHVWELGSEAEEGGTG